MHHLQLVRCLAGLLLFLAFLVRCLLASTTASIPFIVEPVGNSGAARFFYNDDGTDCFSSAIIIGVGTAMTVDDYGELADAVVNELDQTSTLLVIIDPVPHNPIKFYPKPFARAINRLVAQLLEPSSDSARHCLQNNATILVGGHSASGAASFYATRLFDFPVAGFLGLDPFPIQRRQTLSIPALYWGFSLTTCGVSVSHAALAAFNQSMSGYRVMYQLQNNHHQNLPPSEHDLCNYAHCAFTDTGCMFVCPLHCSMQAENDFRRDVATSLRLFLRAISSANDHGPFSQRDFAYKGFHLDPEEIFLIMDEKVEEG